MDGRMEDMILARFFRVFFVGLGLALVLFPLELAAGECFPALFNFGDSTSDTGAIHATFPKQTPAEFPPYGDTFPGKPTNRYGDGRLLIDFIAQALGLNFLQSVMQPAGTDFSQGANFATAGGTVLPITYMSPFPLPVQYLQFIRFQREVLALRSDPETPPKLLSRIPPVDAFSKALYTIALGGNDFTYGYTKAMTIEEVDEYLPMVADGLVSAVKLLYDAGGRHFIVWDIEPMGCLPYMLTFIPHKPEDLNEHGCLQTFNDATFRFNSMLKGKLAEARTDLPDLSVHLLSTWDIKTKLESNLTENGFKYDTKACCGVPSEYNYHLEVNCGKAKTLRNGVTYTPVKCSNPNEYLVWDGVHNTEAANRYVASMMFSGGYFDVPFPELTENCGLKDIA